MPFDARSAALSAFTTGDYATYSKWLTTQDQMRTAAQRGDLRTGIHFPEDTMANMKLIRELRAKHNLEELRATEGKRNSAVDQATIQSQHDLIHTAHAHAISLGAECNGPLDSEPTAEVDDDTNTTKDLAAFAAPDAYAKDVAKMRAAQGLVRGIDYEISPDLGVDGYAISAGIIQARRDLAEPELVALSAAERVSLGGYADGIAKMRSAHR
jgi:hypothetical protein